MLGLTCPRWSEEGAAAVVEEEFSENFKKSPDRGNTLLKRADPCMQCIDSYDRSSSEKYLTILTQQSWGRIVKGPLISMMVC